MPKGEGSRRVIVETQTAKILRAAIRCGRGPLLTANGPRREDGAIGPTTPASEVSGHAIV